MEMETGGALFPTRLVQPWLYNDGTALLPSLSSSFPPSSSLACALKSKGTPSPCGQHHQYLKRNFDPPPSPAPPQNGPLSSIHLMIQNAIVKDKSCCFTFLVLCIAKIFPTTMQSNWNFVWTSALTLKPSRRGLHKSRPKELLAHSAQSVRYSD